MANGIEPGDARARPSTAIVAVGPSGLLRMEVEPPGQGDRPGPRVDKS